LFSRGRTNTYSEDFFLGTVLIVDDDQVLRKVLHELFSVDHLCHSTDTAEQALTLLEAGHFDVAIVDISLPGMSGLELLGHIRQRWPETPVIIITGIDYRQYVADLIRMGASDYLVKPFHLDDVEAKVARAILEKEGWLEAVKESADRLLKPGSAAEAAVERRRATRHPVQRAARLLFTSTLSEPSARDGLPPPPSLVGHTRDISETGVSLIVTGLHKTDSEFFGIAGRLRIIISLPRAIIDVEVEPVRFEWLGGPAENKSYLIGAHITQMSDEDRNSFGEYLGSL
jgi:DNA-binding NarL/FixJ family response regulator